MKYLVDSYKKEIVLKVRQAERVFFMLDFDGTLAPIVAMPEQARLPVSTAAALTAISRNSHDSLAIITGRTVDQVKSFLKIEGLIYAGNHGLELEGPQFKYMHAQGFRFKKIISEVKKELVGLVGRFPRFLIEDKEVSLSCHYRLLDSKNLIPFHEEFNRILAPYLEKKEVHVVEAKKVYEVRPRIHWNKGSAVRWLLLHEDPSALPVYIGDDKPDEPAFKALEDRGVTIRVGYSPDSSAQYFVQDVREAEQLLTQLSRVRRNT